MKARISIMLIAAAMMVFALMPVASPDQVPCEIGRQYAQTHIVPNAKDGSVGQGHKPGQVHQGFANIPAICDSFSP